MLNSLQDFKQVFDKKLVRFFTEKKRSSMFNEDPFIKSVLFQLEKIALSGGKRIRPYLAFLSLQSFDPKSKEIPEAFVGLELFHLFALVHDDIIDESAARHGVQTIHEFVSRTSNANDKATFGKNQALLAGDLLFNWSYEALLQAKALNRERILAVFREMVDEVIVGQMLDVAMTAAYKPTLPAIMKKTELKTARYTFVNPFKIGIAFTGISERKSRPIENLLEKIGTWLGIAFQLQDDLHDIVKTKEELGKEPLGDIQEGQHTFFTDYVRTKGIRAHRTLLESYFGKPLTASSRHKLIDMFQNSGSLRAGQNLIEEHLAQARKHISKLPIRKNMLTKWDELLLILEKRSL